MILHVGAGDSLMSVGVIRMPSAFARSGSRNTSTTSISYRSGTCAWQIAVRFASACAEFCVPSAVYSRNLNIIRRFMICSPGILPRGRRPEAGWRLRNKEVGIPLRIRASAESASVSVGYPLSIDGERAIKSAMGGVRDFGGQSKGPVANGCVQASRHDQTRADQVVMVGACSQTTVSAAMPRRYWIGRIIH